MERQRAILASATVAGAVVLGALAFTTTSALGARGADGVGRLQPVASTVTVVVDPTTGAAMAVAPTPTTAAASPVATPNRSSHERDEDEDEDEEGEHDD